MSFLQRFMTGMQYAFNGKGVVNVENAWQEGQRATYREVNFENMVTHGYRKNELIFACISKTANSAAQVSLQLRKKRGGAVVTNHPALDVIREPNPEMGEFDLYSAILTLQKLAGRAVFEKERNLRGQPVRLWPLRPDWLTPVPMKGNEKLIERYDYLMPGAIKPISLAAQDVMDFKVYDPINRFHSYPPVAVAARVGDVDNSTTDFLKLFFEKGGVPPGLLKTKQKLIDSQVEDIRRRWRERYGGVDKWIEPAVLDMDAEYQKTGLSIEEMGFEVLDARNEARICMVLDVPPILVGANVGLARATYSNYREARKAWWEDSLAPVYQNLLDVIQNKLVAEFDTSVEADWDFSGVAAFQEEIDNRWRRATDALRSGAITVNQFAAEVGLPDQGEAGEYYLRSLNTVEVPSESGTRPEVSAVEPVNSPDAIDDGMDPEKAEAKVDEKVRGRHERVIRAEMEKYFEGQLKRVIS